MRSADASPRVDRALRTEVWRANVALYVSRTARFTFGNASAIDRHAGLVVIKPSGVPYDALTRANLVVTDLDGRQIGGKLRPSSDLATHLVLYRTWPHIGGIVHTHSRYATAWAQAGRELPCLGTTHADYFHGPVPLTRCLSAEEIGGDYEAETGLAIVERFEDAEPPVDARATPAVLVAGHASFCWGESVTAAAHTAEVLEEVARMAYYTVMLMPGAAQISGELLDKHYFRKHGPTAYYGQHGKVP